MKSKISLPLILLMLILPLLTCAINPLSAQENNSVSESVTESPTSKQSTPDWAQILPLDPATAQIIGEEIDKSLADSWNEGYKAARVEYDYWITLAQSTVPDRFWDGFIWGVVPETVAGFFIGTGTIIGLLQVMH